MNNENNEYTLPPQTTWLSLEEHLRAALSGEQQKDALDFIAYLKAGGVTLDSKPPHVMDSGGSKGYCYSFGSDERRKIALFVVLVIEPFGRGWTVCMGSADNGSADHMLTESERQTEAKSTDDEALKEFAWKHVRICQHFRTNGKECGCGNQPGIRVTVFGKAFDNNCNGNIEINNPHGETLESAKRLADVWK